LLDDPEVQRRSEPVTDTVASNLVSEGEGDEIPSPPDDQSKADRGTPSHGTQSEGGERHKKLTPPQLEEIMKISSRGNSVQGDPYKKYLSKRQEALVHR
jgi:hypothetical protein